MEGREHSQNGEAAGHLAAKGEIRWGRFVDDTVEAQFQVARIYSLVTMGSICFPVYFIWAMVSTLVDIQLLDTRVFLSLLGWRLLTVALLATAAGYCLKHRKTLTYIVFSAVISATIVLILSTNIPISLLYLESLGRSDRLLQISLFSAVTLVCHPGTLSRIVSLAFFSLVSLLTIDTLGSVSAADASLNLLSLLVVNGVAIGGNLVWAIRSREAFMVNVKLAQSEAELRKLRELQAKTAFQALERRDAQWSAVVEQTPVVVLTVDRTGVVAYANSRANELGFRVGDFIDSASGEVDGRWLRTQVVSVFDEAKTRSFDLVLGSGDNTSHWTFHAAPVGFERKGPPAAGVGSGLKGTAEQVTLVGLDSTEAWKLRFELRRKSREGCLGSVVTSISHDFNNILMVIVGSAELLSFDIGEKDASQSEVRAILDAGQRADELIRRLLKFVRGAPSRPEVHDINALIYEMSSLLRYVSGTNNRFRLIRSKTKLQVRIDKTEFEQILVNLCSNAKSAIDHSGDITVSTGFDSRGRVQITVQDNGRGIPDEVKTRMFEPYYTTRAEYGGSGVGLATVRGIVVSAGGEIRVESAAGRGSEFRIYLPAAVAKEAPESTPVLTGSSESWPKVALVVDENEDTRRLASSMLKRMGCSTVIAAGQQSAIEQALDFPQIDLLLTEFRHDLQDSLALESKVRDQHPNLATLYCTGHIDSLSILEQVQDQKLVVLQKPYTSTDLAKAIARAGEALPGPKAKDYPALN